jgi:hypothetical protein
MAQHSSDLEVNSMKALSLLLPAVLAILPAVTCAAADFDGSKPLLCATIDVSSCAPGQDCGRESAQSVNAPQFFTVDVGKQMVSAAGTEAQSRTSKIEHVAHQSGLMLLSGFDGDEAWTATIGESDGKLTYAVVGDRMAVVAFGACLTKP